MKLRQLLKYLNESSEEESLGQQLLSDGWKVHISYYLGLIKITSPDDKVTELTGKKAEEILKKIGRGVNGPKFVLGFANKNNLFESNVMNEGVYDPGILKAIFLVGGPGSGKSYITQQIFGITSKTTFSRHGLKLVNPDPAFEKMLKAASINPSDLDKLSKADPENYAKTVDPIRLRAKDIENKLERNYMNGRIGIILEGTGKNVNNVKNLKARLEDIGYDCYLMYVNVDLETAKKRNQMRDRTIPEDLLTQMWSDSQRNLGELQRIFGAKNTLIIDNSEDSKIGPDITKSIETFIRKPISNPIGRDWVRSELKNRAR